MVHFFSLESNFIRPTNSPEICCTWVYIVVIGNIMQVSHTSQEGFPMGITACGILILIYENKTCWFNLKLAYMALGP